MKKLLVTLMLVVSMTVLCACGSNKKTAADDNKATNTEENNGSTASDDETVIEGKNITIVVADDQGIESRYEFCTEGTTLQEAMDELAEADENFSYGGSADEGGYYYVDTVNGLYADYNLDGAYWAIYVGDDTDMSYAMNGIESEEIIDETCYYFVYTVFVWEGSDSEGEDADEECHIYIQYDLAGEESQQYDFTTTATTLRGAMDELASMEENFSYDGYESDWGYYLTTINGVTADYENDGTYWSIYVDTEYASYGIDEQPVKPGVTYSFLMETYSY